MRFPDFVLYFLYRYFGIMNCKKCGELMFNPTTSRIVKHIEDKHEGETL